MDEFRGPLVVSQDRIEAAARYLCQDGGDGDDDPLILAGEWGRTGCVRIIHRYEDQHGMRNGIALRVQILEQNPHILDIQKRQDSAKIWKHAVWLEPWSFECYVQAINALIEKFNGRLDNSL